MDRSTGCHDITKTTVENRVKHHTINQLKTNLKFATRFNLWSANAFNLDQTKNFSFGKELKKNQDCVEKRVTNRMIEHKHLFSFVRNCNRVTSTNNLKKGFVIKHNIHGHVSLTTGLNPTKA